MQPRWDHWVHAVWSTHGHWLPGDPRGFRDRRHRIHSSGDYKNPPPPSEHAGLRRWAKDHSGPVVLIPPSLRRTIAEALAAKFVAIAAAPRMICVGMLHAHALVLVGARDAKPLVGRAKQFASHRVRADLPGKVWCDGCHTVRISDSDHFANAAAYIGEHASEGAAVWGDASIDPILHPDREW